MLIGNIPQVQAKYVNNDMSKYTLQSPGKRRRVGDRDAGNRIPIQSGKATHGCKEKRKKMREGGEKIINKINILEVHVRRRRI